LQTVNAFNWKAEAEVVKKHNLFHNTD